ncbi:MAG: alanine--glyoxylate aminotransferase family protein [Planctomycetota bacterium]|nr:alanine--glyoxylate aminotransferase family protein [Planctomycetota bacterium]
MAAKLYFKQRVMTPGPTSVPEAVLLEMAQPIIHHRTKQFQAIFKELSERLQRVFRTTGPVLSLAGSGTTSFEACQICLARPGSKVIAVAGGKFGERWQDIYDAYAKTLDLTVIKLNVPWGQAVTAEQIRQAIEQNPGVSAVALCHSETSTATACDVESIAAVTKETDALLLVDGITSVGAMPVEMDAWGIDCLVTGSQKALMLPPGLGFVGLGPRAIQRLTDVKPQGVYNLDLRRWLKSWQKNDVPFTPPVSLIRGQRVALEMIEAEGLENVCARAARLAAATRTAFTAMGLKLCSSSPSDSVTGAFYPETTPAIDDKKFRAGTRDNFGIHLAGGQSGRGAEWEGKTFRVSHMGYVDAGDTLAAIAAIEAELRRLGHKVEPGTGIAAAAKALA